MKSILTLGVIAVVLFTAAAGLSTYLTMQKQTPTEEPKDTAAKRKPKDREPDDTAAIRTSPQVGSENAERLGKELNDRLSRVKDRETRLDSRERQFETVLVDFRAEREAVERTRKLLADELKLLAAKSADLEKQALALEDLRKQISKGNTELVKSRVEVQKDESTNLVKVAALYDAMPPENAAKLLTQMADTGKLDTAVKIVANMKPSKASKALSEMTDPSLANQIIDKWKSLKSTPTTPEG